MQALSVSTHRLGLCLLVVSLLVATDSVQAQGQCSCRNTRPFADCVTRVFGLDLATQEDSSYPDLFPGSGTIVPSETEKDRLYIADLFSGRAYVYEYDTTLLETVQLLDLVIPSPAGSLSTTGLTFLNDFLLWAVTDDRDDEVAYEIWRTDVDGNDPTRLGAVDMAELAALVAEDSGDTTIVEGSLGGIVHHASRGTLWAVDIVNDLYFELETNGNLVLNDDGKPNYFFNPLRNTTVGGAYGNDLTYVANGDGEFFDLPIGALSDGRPTRVTRVRATAGDDFEIGDETGVFYNLDENLEAPQFVTGIVFWNDACAAGQHSEVIFDIDLSGGPPRVIEITADDPTGGSVAGFSCAADENDPSGARLTWYRDFPYESLEITRRSVNDPPGAAEVVFSTNFEDDPEEFSDTGLLTGTYEYVLTVAGVDGGSAAPQTCRVNIGRGQIVRFTAVEGAVTTPYAATIIPGDTLVVVDLQSGEANGYDLSLNPTEPLSSPNSTGFTTGVTFNSNDGLIHWLQSNSGSYFLTGMTPDGATLTDAVRIDVPLNFERGMQLGDVAYDATRDWYWTIDLLNQVLFPVQSDGVIPEAYRSEQISLDDASLAFTGGLALIATDDDTVTLDFTLDNASTRTAGVYSRVEIELATGNQTGVFQFDLASAIDTSDVGGLAVAGPVSYVVSMDAATIFALQIESQGLAFFRRGDVNDDGNVNISDPSALLGALFLGDSQPSCDAASDVNGDNTVELADAVFLFNYLFVAGDAPAAPFPTCGVDTETTLSCGDSSCVPD